MALLANKRLAIQNQTQVNQNEAWPAVPAKMFRVGNWVHFRMLSGKNVIFGTLQRRYEQNTSDCDRAENKPAALKLRWNGL